MILALKSGLYAGTKQAAGRMYREHIDDEWSDLPATIFEQCKLVWRHRVPEAENDRQQLRDLCRRMLGFENYLLSLCKEYLAAALESEDQERALMAVQMLGRILYDDPSIVVVLRRLAGSEGTELRHAAERTLVRLRQAQTTSPESTSHPAGGVSAASACEQGAL